MTSNSTGKVISNESENKVELIKSRDDHECEICGKVFSCKELFIKHFESGHKNYLAAQQKIQVQKTSIKEESCQFEVEIHKNATLSENSSKGELKPTILPPISKENTLKNAPKIESSETKQFDRRKEPITEAHVCEFCDKAFKEKDLLKRHIEQVHKGTNRVDCDECNKTFSFSGDLKKHVKNVHQGESIDCVCKHCGKSYKMQKNLNRHIREVHENRRSHQCDLCQKTFKRPVQLSEHKEFSHNPNRQNSFMNNIPKDLKCSSCNESFTTSNDFKDHISRVHENRKILSCDLCLKTFTRPISLRCHVKSTHKGENHKCEICHKTFNNTFYMKNHVKVVHVAKTKIIHKCDICENVYDSAIALQSHKRKMHEIKLTHNCTECNEMFASLANYKDHMILQHSEDRSKRIFCDSCGKIFASEQSLSNHNKSVHNIGQQSRKKHKSSRKVKCQSCDELFVSRSSLFRHLGKKHSDIEILQCSVCKVKFLSSTEFKAHVQKCSNPKYKCGQCDKSFKKKVHLIIHEKVHWVFKCKLCSKKFKSSRFLKIHSSKVHVKEKVKFKSNSEEMIDNETDPFLDLITETNTIQIKTELFDPTETVDITNSLTNVDPLKIDEKIVKSEPTDDPSGENIAIKCELSNLIHIQQL